MKSFVIVYDRRAARLVECREFGDHEANEANAYRFRRELDFKTDPNVEVVLVRAASRAAVERSHGNYFHTPGELVRRAFG